MSLVTQTSVFTDVLPPDYINSKFTVPLHRQLIVSGRFVVDTDGFLILDGILHII